MGAGRKERQKKQPLPSNLVRHGNEASQQYAVVGAGALRKLDLAGREIASDLDYELRRTSEIDPIAGTFRLRGEYTYMADAALFTECLTGARFPVALEKDNVALERAYLAARPAPGAPLLVTLDGSLARRPKMDGDGDQEVLVVERFDRVWPGESCASRR